MFLFYRVYTMKFSECTYYARCAVYDELLCYPKTKHVIFMRLN